MKKLSKKQQEVWKKYKIPSCSPMYNRKVNQCNFSKGNSLEHERAKFEIAFEIMKNGGLFIMEAERVKRDENGKRRIVDVVDLNTGHEFEIIYKHESDEQIKKYREDGILSIIVNPMTCEKCGKIYPKRGMRNICQLCKRKI